MFLRELVISGRTIKSCRISFSSMLIFSLVMVCACAGTVGAKRQAVESQDRQVEKPQPIGRIPLYLKAVYLSVYDRDGKLVDRLPREAFHVFEDNAEQKISEFRQVDEPLRIGLLVDSSGSMFHAWMPTKEAVDRFVHVSNAEDKFFGATFDDSVHPAASIEELKGLMFARGSTKMRDALYFGLVELEDTHNSRKALLIISDGGDNNSKHTRDDLRKMVREAGVPIYALRLPEDRPGEDREQLTAGSRFLDELCKMSGGRFVSVKGLSELPDLAAEIATELRKQYMVGYYPTNLTNRPNDVRWRKIEVKVQSKDVRGPLKVYAPTGYFRTVDGNIL